MARPTGGSHTGPNRSAANDSPFVVWGNQDRPLPFPPRRRRLVKHGRRHGAFRGRRGRTPAGTPHAFSSERKRGRRWRRFRAHHPTGGRSRTPPATTPSPPLRAALRSNRQRGRAPARHHSRPLYAGFRPCRPRRAVRVATALWGATRTTALPLVRPSSEKVTPAELDPSVRASWLSAGRRAVG